MTTTMAIYTTVVDPRSGHPQALVIERRGALVTYHRFRGATRVADAQAFVAARLVPIVVLLLDDEPEQ